MEPLACPPLAPFFVEIRVMEKLDIQYPILIIGYWISVMLREEVIYDDQSSTNITNYHSIFEELSKPSRYQGTR